MTIRSQGRIARLCAINTNTHTHTENTHTYIHYLFNESKYVWSAFSAECGSTGHGYQSCLLSAEQGKTTFSLSPPAPEILVSRDSYDRPVPRQPAHSPHSG